MDNALSFPNRRWETEARELATLQYAVTRGTALLGTSLGRVDLCEKAIQSVKVALVVKLQFYFAG